MKSNKPVIIWLFIGVVLIILMVAVGGAVRLTNSGLSIVHWSPITGIVPPLTEKDWQQEFEAYKQIPEYEIEHSYFKLKDFKRIYLWEYFHRLIARLVGFVFIIPFLFFWRKGYFTEKKLLLRVLAIFFVAAFQAWLGWYMVSSGLSDNTDVSHYRLAIHLFVATFLVSLVLWTALDLQFKDVDVRYNKDLLKYSIVVLALLVVQIVYGAFMAGLNAGYYYLTYPKMGNSWFPKSAQGIFKSEGLISLVENPSLIHFIHRWYAVVIVFAIFMLYMKFKKPIQEGIVKRLLNYSLLIVSVQFLLGVLTLLLNMKIYIAILHQVNGILLFLILVSQVFFSYKGLPQSKNQNTNY